MQFFEIFDWIYTKGQRSPQDPSDKLESVLPIMALADSPKKGGRYTRKEQEERRLQVYQLYFKEKKSAVQIGEDLGINRNTISADIQFLHTQILQKSGGIDFEAMMNRTILEKKLEKERLLDCLEEAETIDEKIKLEKFIFEIENWLVQFYSKALSRRKEKGPTKEFEIIKEADIHAFVTELIWDDFETGLVANYSEEMLKNRYIYSTKSNVKQAERAIQTMKDMGLKFCMNSKLPILEKNEIVKASLGYDMVGFAAQRGYVTPDELDIIFTKQEKILKTKKM